MSFECFTNIKIDKLDNNEVQFMSFDLKYINPVHLGQLIIENGLAVTGAEYFHVAFSDGIYDIFNLHGSLLIKKKDLDILNLTYYFNGPVFIDRDHTCGFFNFNK